MNSFSKYLPVFFLILIFSDPSFVQAAKPDTTGIGKKLDLCYKLNNSRDETVIYEAKKLLIYASAYPKSDLEARIYTLIGRGFLNKRIIDSANFYLSKINRPFNNSISFTARFDYLICVARISNISRSFTKSIETDLEAFELAKRFNDKKSMAIALKNIAHTNLNLGRLDQALEHLKMAKEYSLEVSDSVTYSYIVATIGSVYFQKDDYSKAILYYKDGVEILSKLKIYSELRMTTSLLADCYYNAKNYKAALYYVNISEKLKSDSIADFVSLYNYSICAKSNFKIGNTSQAKYFADLLMKYKNSSEAEELKIDFLRIAIEIYSATNNYDKAISLIKQYDSLTNNLTDSLKNAYAVDKEFDFRFSNVKAELKRIKAEKQVQDELNELQERVLLISLVAVALLLVLLGTGIVSYRRKIETSRLLNLKNQQIEEQLQIVKSQNELQLLTIGVVGHDLRGPLSSSISMRYILDKYFEQRKFEEIKMVLGLHFESLERMHNLAQNLVSWVLSAKSGLSLNFEKVSISDVVNHISYNLNSLITDKGIIFENQIPSTAVAYVDAPSTETILRNIIQNAIKFTEIGKHIRVVAEASESGKELKVTVIDEGKGMPTDVLEKLNTGKRMISLGTKGEMGNGLGLIMIQTLLSLNNGQMQISSEVGVGTMFSVILPTKA